VRPIVERCELSRDGSRELRDATFADKDSIIEKLTQSGHPNVRAVLTGLLEDRLYARNDDQKIFPRQVGGGRGYIDA